MLCIFFSWPFKIVWRIFPFAKALSILHCIGFSLAENNSFRKAEKKIEVWISTSTNHKFTEKNHNNNNNKLKNSFQVWKSNENDFFAQISMHKLELCNEFHPRKDTIIRQQYIHNRISIQLLHCIVSNFSKFYMQA